jgi:hypothetical protein
MTTFLIILGILFATSVVAIVAYKKSPKAKNFIDEQSGKLRKFWNQRIARRRTNGNEAEVIEAETEEMEEGDDNNAAFTMIHEDATAPVRQRTTMLKPTNWQEWFAAFAGTPMHLYRKAPGNVQTKRWILGASVFTILIISSILAGLAYGSIYAVPIALGITVAVCVGLTWFWLIRSIEIPFMVSFDSEWAGVIKNGNPKPNRLGGKMLPAALVRIFISFCISAIVSTFILMLIFRSEIALQIDKKRDASITQSLVDMNARIAPLQGLKDQYQARYDQAKAAYEGLFASERAEIARLKTQVEYWQKQLAGEIAGKVGSGKEGDGATAKADRKNLEDNQKALAQAQAAYKGYDSSSSQFKALQIALHDRDVNIAPLDIQIAAIRADQVKTAARLGNAKMDGLIDRYNALLDIAKDSPLYWLYYALFLAIEMMPLILKITLGPDAITYAIAMENKENEANEFYAKEKVLMDLQVKHEMHMGNQMTALINNRQQNLHQVQQANKNLRQSHMNYLDDLNQHLIDIQNKVNDMTGLDSDERKKVFNETKKEFLWVKKGQSRATIEN